MRVNLNDEQKKMTIKEKEKNVRNLIIMNKDQLKICENRNFFPFLNWSFFTFQVSYVFLFFMRGNLSNEEVR